VNRFPALASRSFFIFWVGQFISLVGTWMQNTVQPYLAYQLTSQPIYLGLIGFAGTLPALLITLPSGVFIERFNKRNVVIIMQAIMMLQAFILAFLTLTGRVTIWHIFGLTLVLGIANAIEISARQAMIAELVDKEALPNAIALNSTIFNTARVIGPSIAAPFLVFLHGTGEGWAFFTNGVSYLFVIIGLFFVITRQKPPVTKARQSVFLDFKEGQQYIRKTPLVAILILMVSIPGFIAFPALQQVPVFARDVLHQAMDTEAAVAARNSLMITFQGMGALIAALFLAVYSTIRHKGWLMTAGQFIFALALVGLALSRQAALTYAMMTLAGLGTVTHLALTNTLIQLHVPDELRGRVISTYIWAQTGVAPFGSLFIGWVAQTAGAPAAALLGGCTCLAAYLIFHFLKPIIRQAEG